MKNAVIYIHGNGGNAEEAEHYAPLFNGCNVIGFSYKSASPWEAKEEFPLFFDKVKAEYDTVTLVCNSIGAYFAMCSLWDKEIRQAFFISPVVNMEKLIKNMMMWAGVTENELQKKGIIQTAEGNVLSWDYISYVRKNPVIWNVPTNILYGSEDALTDFETITEFAGKCGATLTVMDGGEHWFHTEEQMKFLDSWIERLK